jgi:hypothetical protein
VTTAVAERVHDDFACVGHRPPDHDNWSEHAFADIGWTWGGTRTGMKDCQHGSASGR